MLVVYAKIVLDFVTTKMAKHDLSFPELEILIQKLT
jgi:hypothetical protein